MKKYKNIVFDMGNVLLDYSPYTIVSYFTTDYESINALVHEIFYQQEWLDLDQGILNYDDAYRLITSRLSSKHHSIVKDILIHWQDYLIERPEMVILLTELKNAGYKLFLFSNASLRFYAYENRIKCLSLFDKKIISADLKYSKPSDDFYHRAFELCGISAHESFFIDDSVINVLKASQLGMDGYIYNGTYSLLYDYLKRIEVL